MYLLFGDEDLQTFSLDSKRIPFGLVVGKASDETYDEGIIPPIGVHRAESQVNRSERTQPKSGRPKYD